MFNVPQGWHSDSDTVNTGSDSARPPGMFNVPQGWHSDSDTVSTSSVSARPLVCLTYPGMAQRLRHCQPRLSMRPRRRDADSSTSSSRAPAGFAAQHCLPSSSKIQCVLPDFVQHLAAQLVPMVIQAVIAAPTIQKTAVPTANLLALENKSPPALAVRDAAVYMGISTSGEQVPNAVDPRCVATPLGSIMATGIKRLRCS